jgi:hypothetical protein
MFSEYEVDNSKRNVEECQNVDGLVITTQAGRSCTTGRTSK